MATPSSDLGGGGATAAAADAPAAKPAKKRRAPKKKADGAPSKRSKANATYTDMITMAIQALNNRKGSSTPAITAWIGEQYPKLKVKKTTVGAKIRPLVDSGYLIRVKSSFLLSSATKDALRKAKAAAKKADGGGGGGGGGGAPAISQKDRGMATDLRVRKHLGLLPLVSDHQDFDDLTEVTPGHAVAPVSRDALPSPRAKKRRRSVPAKGAGESGAAAPDPDAVQPGAAAQAPPAQIPRSSTNGAS